MKKTILISILVMTGVALTMDYHINQRAREMQAILEHHNQHATPTDRQSDTNWPLFIDALIEVESSGHDSMSAINDTIKQMIDLEKVKIQTIQLLK